MSGGRCVRSESHQAPVGLEHGPAGSGNESSERGRSLARPAEGVHGAVEEDHLPLTRSGGGRHSCPRGLMMPCRSTVEVGGRCEEDGSSPAVRLRDREPVGLPDPHGHASSNPRPPSRHPATVQEGSESILTRRPRSRACGGGMGDSSAVFDASQQHRLAVDQCHAGVEAALTLYGHSPAVRIDCPDRAGGSARAPSASARAWSRFQSRCCRSVPNDDGARRHRARAGHGGTRASTRPLRSR
jgi:hypothetical protein